MLPLLIPSASDEAGEELPDLGRIRELSLKEARDMLNANPNQNFEAGKVLDKVKLVAWGDRPALYLEDRTLAPYVRSFVRFKGERGIARCPQCHQWFVQRRANQIYDSGAHQDRYRVARWRTSGGEAKKKWLVDTIFCRYVTTHLEASQFSLPHVYLTA